MSGWFEISANRRAIAYILFSAIMLGAMIAVGILPTRSRIAETEQQIQQLKTSIEKQEIFHPLYQSLKKKTEETRQPDAFTGANTIGRQGPVSLDNSAGVLESMAESAGMESYSFSPAPGSMEKNDKRLLVHGRLGGGYIDFRKFLINMVTAKGFDRLEMLEAKSAASHPEYRLRIWLRIE
ncbi:MAG: hypothetical protein ACOC0W_04900 [Desulfosalsimonas sp.]